MSDRSAQEDLEMIRRLMQQGRATVRAGAPHYVVWGLLVTAALVTEWARARGLVDVDSLWVWAGLMGAGWAASLIVGARSARNAPVRTAGGRTLMGIWVGTGVTLTLAGFVGVGTGALAGGGMLGLTAAALGGAVFATSFVHDSGLIRAAAVVWWAGAGVLFAWSDPAAILLLAGLTAGLLLAPGIWLLARPDGSTAAAAARGGGAGR
jgi:hypothetical protein